MVDAPRRKITYTGESMNNTAVTNEDLLGMLQNLMQTTNEGFAQVNTTLAEHGKTLAEHSKILTEHGKMLTEQKQETQELKVDMGVLKMDMGEVKTDIGELKIDMGEVKTDIGELKIDVDELKMDMSEVKMDMSKLKIDMSALKATVKDLSDKHAAYINDISDVLDRIVVLEKQSHLTQTEIQELQRHLQTVVDWTSRAARILKIPLKLSS
jgi:chromosome segregation ATPase